MNLNINFDESRRVGSNLKSKSEEFRSLVNKIISINSEIKNYWSGTDADKYFSIFEQHSQYMQLLATVIDEIGDFLIGTAGKYEQASENNYNSINYN